MRLVYPVTIVTYGFGDAYCAFNCHTDEIPDIFYEWDTTFDLKQNAMRLKIGLGHTPNEALDNLAKLVNDKPNKQ